MKFEISLNKKKSYLPITMAALNICGFGGCDSLEAFALPEAMILLPKHMNARQLVHAILSMRLLACRLMDHLVFQTPALCDECDFHCIPQSLEKTIDRYCQEHAQRFKYCGRTIAKASYDMADALYDELAVRGCCLMHLLEHFALEDELYTGHPADLATVQSSSFLPS